MEPKKWSYEIAVTITLPRQYRKLDAEHQHENFFPEIKSCLSNCKKTIVLELTLNQDVHYHGIVQVPLSHCQGKPPCRYIKDRLRKLNSFTCVKQMTSFHGWKDYILKSYEVTKATIEIGPILIDDYDILPILEYDSHEQINME